MKLKRLLKFVILFLIVLNWIILGLLWFGWQMDYQYGDGFEIAESFGENSSYGIVALGRVYSGIFYDIYYFAGFSILLSVCLIALAIINSNEEVEKERNKDKELVS